MVLQAISLWQPWASAVALGIKTIESRSWPASHSIRWLLIHAAKRRSRPQRIIFEGWLHDHWSAPYWAQAGYTRWDQLPFGAMVAGVRLGKVWQVPITESQDSAVGVHQRTLGDYRPGRWAWPLDVLGRIEPPIPWRGRQGIFRVSLPENLGREENTAVAEARTQDAKE
jgi:hypothetical protein